MSKTFINFYCYQPQNQTENEILIAISGDNGLGKTRLAEEFKVRFVNIFIKLVFINIFQKINNMFCAVHYVNNN